MQDNIEEMEKQYDKNIDNYYYLCNVATDLMKELLNAQQINYCSINSRVKGKNSFLNKIIKKDKYSNILDVTDVVGIRIITYYTDDVDKISKIIEQEFKVDAENSIDKSKTLAPDTFGYLSLHYIVSMSNERKNLAEYKRVGDIRFEIQVRTILQHTWAEIEHDIGYKSKIETPSEIRRDFSRLAGLLEIADKEFLGIRNKVEEYKNEVYASNTVYELNKETLKVFLEKSNDIKEFNDQYTKLVNCTKIIFREDDMKEALCRLKWLNIDSINKLTQFIKENKDLAYRIAKERNKKDQHIVSISTCTALYLICTAYLVSNFNKEKVIQYYIDNHLGNSTNVCIRNAEYEIKMHEKLGREEEAC